MPASYRAAPYRAAPYRAAPYRAAPYRGGARQVGAKPLASERLRIAVPIRPATRRRRRRGRSEGLAKRPPKSACQIDWSGRGAEQAGQAVAL